MPKIRDLGVSGVIRSEDTTCSETCPDATAQCEPNSGGVQSRHAGALTNDAVLQLKQQLRNHMR